MKNELLPYIGAIYREPYRLFGNNCIDKSLKIKARGEALGEQVDLILCLVIVRPTLFGHKPVCISPHVYTIINGEKVDVALDPELEKGLGKNSEQDIILPLNISRIGRIIFRRGRRAGQPAYD